MSTHVMLSLDLNHLVGPETRSNFYESLQQSGWVKSALVETVWTKVEVGGHSPKGGGLESFVIGDLGRALIISGVGDLHYMFQVGNSVAVEGALSAPSDQSRLR